MYVKILSDAQNDSYTSGGVVYIQQRSIWEELWATCHLFQIPKSNYKKAIHN